MLVYQRVIEMTMPSWFAYISLDDPESSRKKAQAFVVEAGNLWFNVMVWVLELTEVPGIATRKGWEEHVSCLFKVPKGTVVKITIL